MLWTVLLALTLSLDCLGAGFSYGLQKILLPWYGIVIICCCSGMVLAVSMLMGSWLGQFIAPRLVRFAGAGLLIGLGLCMLCKSIQELVQQEDNNALFQWKLSRFGIVIQILNLHIRLRIG